MSAKRHCTRRKVDLYDLPVEAFKVILLQITSRDRNALLCSNRNSFHITSILARLPVSAAVVSQISQIYCVPQPQDRFTRLPEVIRRQILEYLSAVTACSLLRCNRVIFRTVRGHVKLWESRRQTIHKTLDPMAGESAQLRTYLLQGALSTHEEVSVLESLLRMNGNLRQKSALLRRPARYPAPWPRVRTMECGHDSDTTRRCDMCDNTQCKPCLRVCGVCHRNICRSCNAFCFMCGGDYCPVHAPKPCASCDVRVCLSSRTMRCAGAPCEVCLVAHCHSHLVRGYAQNHTRALFCKGCAVQCRTCKSFSPKIVCRGCKQFVCTKCSPRCTNDKQGCIAACVNCAKRCGSCTSPCCLECEPDLRTCYECKSIQCEYDLCDFTCDVCDRVYCKDHLYQCGSCCEWFTPCCRSTCARCASKFCLACVKDCVTCGKKVCGACVTTESVDGRVVCTVHLDAIRTWQRS